MFLKPEYSGLSSQSSSHMDICSASMFSAFSVCDAALAFPKSCAVRRCGPSHYCSIQGPYKLNSSSLPPSLEWLITYVPEVYFLTGEATDFSGFKTLPEVNSGPNPCSLIYHKQMLRDGPGLGGTSVFALLQSAMFIESHSFLHPSGNSF